MEKISEILIVLSLIVGITCVTSYPVIALIAFFVFVLAIVSLEKRT